MDPGTIVLLGVLAFAALALTGNLGGSAAAAGCAAPAGGAMYGCGFPANWLSTGSAYVPTLNSVESQYGLPTNLLCAVAYAESGFNPSAVNACSGATGMFQLLPEYYPEAGESWQADADSAAAALAAYHSQFNDWSVALAAYNWGPGNVATYESCGGCAPGQTTAYVAAITQAVPAAAGSFA